VVAMKKLGAPLNLRRLGDKLNGPASRAPRDTLHAMPHQKIYLVRRILSVRRTLQLRHTNLARHDVDLQDLPSENCQLVDAYALVPYLGIVNHLGSLRVHSGGALWGYKNVSDTRYVFTLLRVRNY